ncbi:hypothetical protein B0T11DRAFT_298813 [Plectosphaerella cucumerina]|uniref:Uncharacterized protein n=1 Tax=Plectosphaerella cucumerina TaxID=40658 RepID=A0A8K0TGI5_9PEZI|nr:hypothetical protein B0T11DRAFT_298813 [Plectosphaerella cucumerina]
MPLGPTSSLSSPEPVGILLGWEQARKLGELWKKDNPHLSLFSKQVSVCATSVPRTIESAKAFYIGAFPGAMVPAVDLVYNLKPRHAYLEHLRDTFRREDRTSGRPWASIAIQAWDTVESLCASGLHDHLPPIVRLPWVAMTIQREAHREATRPYTDPEALRLAAGPVMSFLADKLHAMYRKYNEEQISQFVLFIGHDWNLDVIQWVLKTPSGAWQRHMDPRSLQIKVLRGGGNFFICVSVNGSPVVIPGCAPAVGKGPAVHELIAKLTAFDHKPQDSLARWLLLRPVLRSLSSGAQVQPDATTGEVGDSSQF